LVLFPPNNAETNSGHSGKLDGHLIASSVRNINAKNY